MAGYRPGDPKGICDICGFEYHLSELRYNWKGSRVCRKDWDPRHPLDYIRDIPDQIPIKDPRPEPDPIYIQGICNIRDRSGRADYGSADCALVDNSDSYVPVPAGTFDGSL